MKIFKNKAKNIGYFCYRIISPLIDPVRLFFGLWGYIWFTRDLILYKIKDPKSKLLSLNLFPILHEKTSITPFDAHYFYQQIWAFENILRNKPQKHVDVGSTYEMSGYLSKIVKTEFVDLRPIETNCKNLKVIKGDITHLPYEDSTLESVSCLHVVEHIGLGRYGDLIDPHGPIKACKELSRTIRKGGLLYISLPIGKPRICFNAHRVLSTKQIIKMFPNLTLVELHIVDDSGKFIKIPLNNLKVTQKLNFGCGMFIFKKK